VAAFFGKGPFLEMRIANEVIGFTSVNSVSALRVLCDPKVFFVSG